MALVSDEFLAETVKNGRPGRRMPGWSKDGGLRSEEISALVAHVRSLAGVPVPAESRPARWISADPAQGKELFQRSCSGCHGPDGKGGEGPALNNKVLLGSATDTFLVETIRTGRRGTAMGSFAEPSPVRAALAQSDIEAVVAYLRSLEGDKQ